MQNNAVGTVAHGTKHGGNAEADQKTQKAGEPWIFHIEPIIHDPLVGEHEIF